MRKLFCILSLIILSQQTILGQELNARVELNAPNVQNLNKRVVNLLQQVLKDFLNNQSWTAQPLKPLERIDCSFIITITEYDGARNFKSDAQIMSSRPVFGTNYHSPILVFRDKNFNFSYSEGEQLDFSNIQNLNSLTALLGFYAHIIIGMDRDTFQRHGGNSAFALANQIVNYSQNAAQEGWRAMESTDNRYWLNNNLLDQKYSAYRDFAYQYHRMGLDQLTQQHIGARKVIADMILTLKDVDRFATGNTLTSSFFAAKSNEFVGLFTKQPVKEKMMLYNLLTTMDPHNITKYEVLKN